MNKGKTLALGFHGTRIEIHDETGPADQNPRSGHTTAAKLNAALGPVAAPA